MKRIRLTRTDFPDPNDNGVRDVQFTEKALLRAVLVVGQGPRPGRKTRAARGDADMRRGAILSAIEMSGNKLTATPEFKETGRTDKGVKSQFVGHALCAHAAYQELRIPWMVDIENLNLVKPEDLTFKNPESRIRPDFIAQDAAKSRWYVFECKGRSAKPTFPDLVKWKQQAEAITHYKGQKIETNIVSAAFLNKQKEWQLLWKDPVPDHAGANLEFDEMDFFNAYYEPVMDLLDRQPLAAIPSSEGVLYYISALDAYVGLHKDIVKALKQKHADVIKGFAHERINTSLDSIEERPVSVFADGVLIALKRDLKEPPESKSIFANIEI
jgi:tRNA U38,U39,U40 pseudouridine synthase TruA